MLLITEQRQSLIDHKDENNLCTMNDKFHDATE